MTTETDHKIEAFRHAAEAGGGNFATDELAYVCATEPTRSADEVLGQFAQGQGFDVRAFSVGGLKRPDAAELPLAIFGVSQSWAVTAFDGTNYHAVEFSEEGRTVREISADKWSSFASGVGSNRAFTLLPLAAVRERLAAEHVVTKPRNWLWDVFREHRRVFLDLSLAAVVSNLLGIATSLFAMQVWDRVVPAHSTNTLWVLVIGVTVAMVFDFILRKARVTITDQVGREADLAVSSRFFAHMLAIRNDARPRAPGTLIAQLRDLEQVRDLLTSTTLGALLDLPFLVVFLIIIWLLGGPLVIVPLLAIPIVALPGLLYQRKLAELSRKTAMESSLRNTILMESVLRAEDIKNLQAETQFRHRWNQVNDVTSRVNVEQRGIVHGLQIWSASIQQLAYIGVVTMGVYLLFNQQISFGAILACSILTSRAIAPISQIALLLGRLQSAKVSKEGLDKLLQLPTDQLGDGQLRNVKIKGQYRVEGVRFTYDPELPVALTVERLNIAPGERVGVIGKIGAGKSTLLRLLAGSSDPQVGKVMLDDANIQAYAPFDLRQAIGPVLQDSALFFGTLKENIKIGVPQATDEDIHKALTMLGSDKILLSQPAGLNLIVREGGQGLSSGQRQAVLMARALLRDPKILILDEPTAAFDDVTEREFLQRLDAWLGDRTLIVSTHRAAVTSLVNRLIVIDQGRILMDGPKDKVIAALSNQGSTQVKEQGRGE